MTPTGDHTVIYGSVCSGIEAASVAWEPLGWRPSFFSEIEPFPRAVLAHHWPEVNCHGDFTTIQAGDYRPIDLLVGGTPCQSFSIAGLRGGLGDDRGNLALEYLRLADRLRPRWLVWENVPGVLSSNGGRDFGSILGGMGELGYGVAYRVLDAQYFGVAQRRRRVFVVGYFGDWRPAAAVLFERHSLQGHPAPRREAGKGFAHPVAPSLVSSGRGVGRTGETRGQDPVVAVHCPDVSPSLKARDFKGPSSDGDGDGDGAPLIAHALRGEGFNASEDGTGRGTPIIAVHGTQDPCTSTDTAFALGRNSGQENAVTFSIMPMNSGKDFKARETDVAQPIMAGGPVGGNQGGYYIATNAVRRLTPRECERLQGFPDDFTAIPWRGKPADQCPDGPRYKALGNSMAVPVMVWIGRRIEQVEAALQETTP